jgi:glycine/D-amino acid oxidase-like deaminating enzyme
VDLIRRLGPPDLLKDRQQRYHTRPLTTDTIADMGSINDVYQTLLSQVNDDPQLPRTNPTEAFWQMPVHESLSAIQSPQLPERTDFAIIGSGVTGCSVAKNLFDNPALPKDSHITVFEARNLCSGATGRNGGALTSFAGYAFTKLVKQFGEDQAIKIGRFAYRTLETMHELGSSSPELLDASEVRRLRDIVGFVDPDAFEAGKVSFQRYDEAIPDCRLNCEILDAEEARLRYNVKNIAGAILFDNGAFWPYRLITRLWAQLAASHPSQLSLETNTPATSISTDPNDPTHPYILSTPRGAIRARHIIHATNGYTGHLLPALRGKLHPLRGTMSVQKSTPAFGQHGTSRTWSISAPSHLDPQTGFFDAGLYYSNQNPKTHDIFIGGEVVAQDAIFVADDSVVRPEAEANIRSVLPRYFEKGWAEGEAPEVRKVWSGIMGFTSDGLPLVGRLGEAMTGRKGGSEWVAAGFNGYGMPQCWGAGEAVAKMLLGQEEDVSSWLPECYLVTEERLGRMSGEESLKHLMG